MRPIRDAGASSESFAKFETRLGPCALAWNERGISAVFLPDKSPAALARRVRERREGAVEREPDARARAAIDAMRALVDDGSADLSEIVLDLRGVPPFHQRVYEAARKIAPGETRTYGALAESLSSPGASRAVGQAMQKNRFPIVVPCHRVLASDMKLGGFSAEGGVETKLRMLSRERDAMLSKKSPGKFAFDPTAAVEHLKSSDKKLRALIERVGPFAMRLDPTPSVFFAVARAIAFQQLTGSAAETIWTRVCALFPFDVAGPSPALVARASDEKLRGAGLSTAKTAAIKDLAKKCADGSVPSLAVLSKLSDEEVIERLTNVRGVGRWTVEMMLMFRLGRGDVWPVDDYGVKKGFARTFGGELPSRAEMFERAAKWAPYRSVASWYLWRANDLDASNESSL